MPKRAFVGKALMSLDIDEGPKHLGVTFKPLTRAQIDATPQRDQRERLE